MWEKFKKEKLEGYLKAKAEGNVDADIVDLLDLINEFDCFVTLSSCSGRIAVLDLKKPGDKVNSEFLGKWHEGVEAKEVKKAAKKSRNTAWLIQNPPIIHVACRDTEAAKILMNIANQAGFRRSGIISLNYTNKLIIDSTIHFNAPAKASFNLSPSQEKPLANHPLGSKAGNANPSS